MGDERSKYFRRLRRLRRSARRWSVTAATLVGAAAVFVPYGGLGWPDAFWAGAAGGSAVLTLWRWADVRQLSSVPPPPPVDPALAAERTRRQFEMFLSRMPAGRAAIEEVRRQRTRLRLRGSLVAPTWYRLERASLALSGLAGRMGGPAEDALPEAAVAERSLRELTDRAASVERALNLAPADTRKPLEQALGALVGQLDGGVVAYERLVAAAAAYVAEDGRTALDHPAIVRLREATDLLSGIAAGLSELRTAGPTV